MGSMENSQVFTANKGTVNQGKATFKMVGNFMVFLFTLVVPLPDMVQPWAG